MPADTDPKAGLDSGTLNSDRVDRDVSRDQLEEADAQEREDAGTMLTDDDAPGDAGAGLAGGGRDDGSTRAIGDLGTQGIDQG